MPNESTPNLSQIANHASSSNQAIELLQQTTIQTHIRTATGIALAWINKMLLSRKFGKNHAASSIAPGIKLQHSDQL